MDHLQNQSSRNTSNNNEEKNQSSKNDVKIFSPSDVNETDKWLEKLPKIPNLDFCSNDDFINKNQESKQCEVKDSGQENSQRTVNSTNVSGMDYSDQNAAINLEPYTFSNVLQQETITESCGSESEVVKSRMRDYIETFISTLPDFSCVETLKNSSDLENYRLTDNEKPEKRFNRHIHTEGKTFACDICDKRFKASSDLTKHRRTHTGEKPYICDMCDKSFRQSSHLFTHRRTHFEEKPYICNMCDKSFKQSGHLTKHRRSHTGEKPYSCDKCKKFSK